MRATKLAAILALIVLSTSLVAVAAPNKYGVADTRKISFSEPIKVGDVVLPKGEYKVQHTMEGENHIMVFTQLKASEPAVAHVKCQLVPLAKKAERTEVMYGHNQTDTHVLQEMVFAGDTAKHVF
jgi:hypothetical protein